MWTAFAARFPDAAAHGHRRQPPRDQPTVRRARDSCCTRVRRTNWPPTAGSGYVAPDWTTVASYHRFGYDELGNQWLDETRSQNSVLWSTTPTIHDGFQRRQYDPNGRRTDYDASTLATWTRWWSTTPPRPAPRRSTPPLTATTWPGALAQVTNAAGNVTSLGYDLLGRKTAMSGP